jgi:hypothetical protein
VASRSVSALDRGGWRCYVLRHVHNSRDATRAETSADRSDPGGDRHARTGAGLARRPTGSPNRSRRRDGPTARRHPSRTGRPVAPDPRARHGADQCHAACASRDPGETGRSRPPRHARTDHEPAVGVDPQRHAPPTQPGPLCPRVLERDLHGSHRSAERLDDRFAKPPAFRAPRQPSGQAGRFGETSAPAIIKNKWCRGRSPRARGSHTVRNDWQQRLGSIPACAGEPEST